MMRTSDLLVYPSRGDAETAIAFARNNGAKRMDEVELFIRTVYDLCDADGMIDAAISVAQSAHETGNWASTWWVERLNPGGLGVTGDPDQNEESPWFEDGAASARAMVSHELVYALGPADAGSLWHQRTGGNIAEDDPRYEAYVEAYGNREMATTLAGLAGTWAVDPDYDTKICQKSEAIYDDLPNQETGGGEMSGVTDFAFDKQMTSRNQGALTKPAWITIHNNGNPSSDPYDEAAFVEAGGGSSGVLYHFAVDDQVVVQIAKMDAKGTHAGNSQGNATSIAIEMCEGADDWGQCKENTAQWLAEIVTNSRGILDYGSFGPEDFSLDRVREHRDWPGANPNCPSKLIATDGGCEKIVARAKEIVQIISEPTEPEPIEPVYPSSRVPVEVESQGFVLALTEGDHRYVATHGGRFKTYPDRDSPDGTPTPYSRGQTGTFPYETEVAEETWLVSSAGSWTLLKNWAEEDSTEAREALASPEEA